MNTPKNRSELNFLIVAIAGHAAAAHDDEIQKHPQKILAKAILDLALKRAAEQKRRGWLCGTYIRSLREGLEHKIVDFICSEDQQALIRYCSSVCSGFNEPIGVCFDNQIDWLLEQTPTIHINQNNLKLHEKENPERR